MLRPTIRLALALTAGACTQAALADTPLRYPETRKIEQVDRYHGQRIADPYRWLEDDNSAATKAWVQAQNRLTDTYFKGVAQREPVRKLYTELFNFEKMGVPFKEGGRYFWTHNNGLQQQDVVYTAAALDAQPQVALDPNRLSADGTVALTGLKPSPDGRLLAYGVAMGGSDWQRWQVRDLASGRDLADKIEWVKFSKAEWTPDGKGFFYSRYDAPKAGEALTGTNYFQKLYYHRLGTEQSADQLVLENKEEKQWGFGAEVSDDGRYALINVWKGSGRKNGLLLLPLKDGGYAGGTPRPLTLAFDAEYAPVELVGDTLYLRSDKDAPRGRLIAIDLKQPEPAHWKTVVAETGDALTGASGVGGRLLLQYLRDASTLVRVHAPDGALLSEVPLPGVGTAKGFGGRWTEGETFFSYASFSTPTEIWRFEPASGKTSLFKRSASAFPAEQFVTERHFVTSKDGTRFPIFIAHRKGLKLDGTAPTLLYGYGGFNVPLTPGYSVTAATWMQMGGVYVSAALRGGGEYGAAWHEAGTKLKKQNVFDDFIAAAEYLKAKGITGPDQLAIEGRSNGGLLVGAVLNQRPDLFAAALPSVGVMDMLRFNRFTAGRYWEDDYGNPDRKADFQNLLSYSPYHNVQGGRSYPAILVTAADSDDRVVPAHSFKYAAALQHADIGERPHLIRIETGEGHGGGKSIGKAIEEASDMYSFIAYWTGLRIVPK